jgi:Zn-dependent protease with chaperone function
MTNHSILTRRLSVLLILAVLVAQVSAQSAAPEFPNPGKPRMSRDQQRQLGLQAAAQVYKQVPVLPDNSPETQYIRQLGQKLVATIPAQYSWPFEFHVVAQKDINAFALPGGPMFVNIGTITAAANEAELAGVMAHEMSHVYMQHSAKQADKAQTTGLWAGLLGAVAGATLGGTVGELAQMGVQFGAQGVMLKYSRADESQADAVGAVIMYKAGHNPQAMADFFKTLESQGGSPPQFLSDHPNPGNRQQAIEKEIRNWPPKNYQTDSAAFRKVQQQAATVKAYTAQEIAAGAKTGQWAALNQRNGAIFRPTGSSNFASEAPVSASSSSPTVGNVSPQSVLPSQRMVAQDLGAIKLSRPENWPLIPPKHRADYATLAPQAGVTANGVGYGVMINAATLPEGERMDIDQATSQLLGYLERAHGVKPAGAAQPITVGGVQGRSVMMESASPFQGDNGQQQMESDWLVVAPRSADALIYFIFIAPQSQFDRFRPAFETMIKSVQF